MQLTTNISVFNVAQYILTKCPNISAGKMHRLVYYSQVWSLIWDDEQLFKEDIMLRNIGPISLNHIGPIIDSLYDVHKGCFKITASTFDKLVNDIDHLTENQKDTIDKVIEFYGDYSIQLLNDITRKEISEFRNNYSSILTLDMICDYYSSLIDGGIPNDN